MSEKIRDIVDSAYQTILLLAIIICMLLAYMGNQRLLDVKNITTRIEAKLDVALTNNLKGNK